MPPHGRCCLSGDSTASEAAASAAIASASHSSSASANPASADPACTAHSSSTPASTASTAAEGITDGMSYTKQAVSRTVCGALLRAGWLDPLARLARMAGLAWCGTTATCTAVCSRPYPLAPCSAAVLLRTAAVYNEHGGGQTRRLLRMAWRGCWRAWARWLCVRAAARRRAWRRRGSVRRSARSCGAGGPAVTAATAAAAGRREHGRSGISSCSGRSSSRMRHWMSSAWSSCGAQQELPAAGQSC